MNKPHREKKNNSKPKERKVVILRDIHDKFIDSVNIGYTLFGNKSYIESKGELYDLIFYGLPQVSLDRDIQATSLVVPVLANDKDYEIKASELKKKYPWLGLFAIVNKNMCIEEYCDKRLLREKTLRFFEIKRSDLGELIKPLEEDYRIVDEERLASISPCPDEFIKYLKEKREFINHFYGLNAS